MLLIDGLISALPILVVAWFIRWISRTELTESSAVRSVIVGGVIGYLTRSFMEGEGGSAERISNVVAPDTNVLFAILLGTIFAAILAYLVARGRKA